MTQVWINRDFVNRRPSPRWAQFTAQALCLAIVIGELYLTLWAAYEAFGQYPVW